METPIRLPTPCMEEHIDAEASGDHWLRTSPEIYHKQLLANGAEKIFEIGKCFRQGERGAWHHPEYTMLEWYRAGGNAQSMADDTHRLLERIADEGPLCSTHAAAVDGILDVLKRSWLDIPVREAYLRFAGWDPVEAFDAVRFDLDMVERIEPNLPQDVPVTLSGFPAERCALARLSPKNPAVAERWELYLCGREIANAYTELTDSMEMRVRFERWATTRREQGRRVYSLDESFIQSLDRMPDAGGCALGVDRLLMLMTGATSMEEVLPFGREP